MDFTSFSFVDIETTGTSNRFDRVIEIGIIHVEKGKVVKTFETLINPAATVSPFIEELTGISADMLEAAPLFADVAEEIFALTDNTIFVAHNARFDYGFLRHEFRRLNLTYKRRPLCSVKLSRRLFPQYLHHNLDSLITRFHLRCPARHRALADATVIWNFFKKLPRYFSTTQIEDAFRAVLKRPTLPQSLKETDIDDIPETPGVYIFYGNGDIPLYIGKSINLHNRILSHFFADRLSVKEMHISRQITRIETIETAGELEALLQESTLIKKLRPFYNRRLRQQNQLCVVKKDMTPDGYLTSHCQYTNAIDPQGLDAIIGIYKTKRQAKDALNSKVKEYGLCQKLLNLEKTKATCFAAKLGTCRGACVGLEKPVRYNLRFIDAFSKTKIKCWPFPGPILITDTHRESAKSKGFIVHNWCLIGELENDEVYEDGSFDGTKLQFDYDTYKILARFIFAEKNQRKIKKLKKHDYTHATKSHPSAFLS
ncbi:3'-5' exoribonuclease [Candidatus Roizmanbacteria bacterium]|nr:3'-5' exoribonuclease [Candidatus Roizmanbacteria bacterium]